MIIGHDVSVCADNHTASRSVTVRFLVLALLGLLLSASLPEEVAEEIAEGIAHDVLACASRLRHLDVGNCIDRLLGSISEIDIPALGSRGGSCGEYRLGSILVRRLGITNDRSRHHTGDTYQGHHPNQHFNCLFHNLSFLFC